MISEFNSVTIFACFLTSINISIKHTGEFINQNERRPITLIEKKGQEQLAQEEISQEKGEERKE